MPERPGLCVYRKVRDMHGLEVGRRIIYTGQAENLYQRLVGHCLELRRMPSAGQVLIATKKEIQKLE